MASGYLKAESYTLNEETGADVYELALTNKEVQIMFRKMIRKWFSSMGTIYNGFIRALLQDDVKSMNAYMNRVTASTFSYFDTGRNPLGEAEPERFYHGFVLGLMVELEGRYRITSNRESGFGRYDIMLTPTDRERDCAYIIEFKVYKPMKERILWKQWKMPISRLWKSAMRHSLLQTDLHRRGSENMGLLSKGKSV